MTDKTQEPVAFDVVCHDCGGDGFDRQDSNYRCTVCNGAGFIEKMLYTSPPATKPNNCTRSHPHENMDAMCELRTEIARLTNENARLKLQRGVS